MSSPGGQVIGRVSIKVLPDTSDFRRRLKNALDRIEKQVQFAGQVKLEVDKQSMKEVEKQLKDWAERISPLKVGVRPHLIVGSTTWIEKRLQYLTRPRAVPIFPYLNRGAMGKAAAGIGAFIAALSGGRVLKDMGQRVWDLVKNIDKAVPSIAAFGSGLGLLTAILLTSVSNLFALGSSLASIGAVLLTMPATFAAIGIGIGVAFAALKDFNKVLPEVGSAFKRMQDVISSNFWAKAEEPMRRMLDNLLPQLSEGFGKTATALGGFFASLSTALNGSLDGAMGPMFDQLAASIEIAKGAAEPLANVIKTFGEAGSAYLPRMAEWVVQIADRFDQWLTRITGDGTFDTWVENGLSALSALGDVLYNLGGIFSGIADAANRAGGSSLQMFADTLEKVHAVVDSPAFQAGLTAAFEGAHAAISAITTGAGPQLADFFSALGTSLGSILPIIGGGLATAIGAIAEGLSALLASGGVEAMFSGISAAFAALAPVMAPLGTALGMIGKLLGHFAAQVGPILAVALGAIIDAFMALMPALFPVITVLSGVLMTAVQALAPVLVILGQVLGTVLMEAVKALAPALVMVGQVIGMLAPLVGQLLMAIVPLIAPILTLVMAVLKPLLEVVMAIISAAMPPLIAAFGLLVSAIVPVLGILTEVVTWIMGYLAPVLTWLGEALVGGITGLIEGITGMFAGFTGIWEGFRTMFSGGWSNFWNGLLQVLSGIGTFLLGLVKWLWNVGVLGLFKLGWIGIKALFTGAGKFLSNAVKTIAFNIKSGFSLMWIAVKNYFKNWWRSFKAEWTGVGTELKTGAQKMWEAVKGAFSRGFNHLKGQITGLPGKIRGWIGNAGNVLKGVGEKIIQGLITGISGMFDSVKGKLGELTQKIKDWKGPEPVDKKLLTPAGEFIIDSLVKGFENRYDAVRKSLQGLTRDIANHDFGTPTIAPFSGLGGSIDAALGTGSPVARDLTLSIDARGTGATPDDIADAMLFGLRRAATGGVYA